MMIIGWLFSAEVFYSVWQLLFYEVRPVHVMSGNVKLQSESKENISCCSWHGTTSYGRQLINLDDRRKPQIAHSLFTLVSLPFKIPWTNKATMYVCSRTLFGGKNPNIFVYYEPKENFRTLGHLLLGEK